MATMMSSMINMKQEDEVKKQVDDLVVPEMKLESKASISLMKDLFAFSSLKQCGLLIFSIMTLA